MQQFRVGQGFDIHRFTVGNAVTLGGVKIPYEKSLDGHSDADVLVHALMDALLGAAGLMDIGTYFPNTDPAYKGISSIVLLQHVVQLVHKDGWQVENIDATVIAEAPKIQSHVPAMKELLASSLQVAPEAVGIKATTAEKLGALGRSEGISAQAVVLLSRERP